MGTGGQQAPIGPHVPIPDRLLRQAEPEVIGLYALVARLFLDYGAPVPLSSRDVAVWLYADPNHAARRRFLTGLQRLTTLGWLVAETSGRKHAFIPTWGQGRDGTPHVWDSSQTQYGRPRGVTYRPLPIAFLDLAVGRWTPRAGCRTPVTRLLSAPLLDARDLGTYVLAQLVPTPLTPRLHQLGLHAPVTPQALSAAVLTDRARAGTLTTLNAADEVISVMLAICGMDQDWITAGSLVDRRVGPQQNTAATQQDAVNTLPVVSDATRHDHADAHEPDQESTPPGSPAAARAGGAAAAERLTDLALDPAVITNHEQLNPNRQIDRAEWAVIAQLQTAHGSAALQAWQQRALRAHSVRPSGIYPGYYRRCADAARPAAPSADDPPAQAPGDHEHQAARRPALNAALRAALAQLATVLGEPIRRPERLAHAAPDLIVAWASVAKHVGLRRWRDPRCLDRQRDCPPPAAAGPCHVGPLGAAVPERLT